MTTKSIQSCRGNYITACKDIFRFFNDESKDLYITVTDDKSKLRTNAQNGLIQLYYKAIGDFMGYDVEESTARCKRKFGLPIMYQQAYKDTQKAKVVYRELLRVGLINNPTPPERAFILTNYHNLSEEGQIECFKLIACTRNFNTTEMKEYIDTMERFFAEKGLVLESINEVKRREAFM